MNIILKVFRLSIKFVPVTGNDFPSYVPQSAFLKSLTHSAAPKPRPSGREVEGLT
ncbi:MAG: hypothetical protein AB1502_17125 [Thermodesulfobacteriota bacterium]